MTSFSSDKNIRSFLQTSEKKQTAVLSFMKNFTKQLKPSAVQKTITFWISQIVVFHTQKHS